MRSKKQLFCGGLSAKLGGALLGAVTAVAGSLFLAQPASAVPAAPGAHTLAQPNGQTFQSYYKGDEFFNWHVTADGRPIVETANKTWVYAKPAAGGGLAATNLVVGQTAVKNVIEPFKPQVTSAALTARASRDARNAVTLAKRAGKTSGVGTRAVPPTGRANILVILVNFSDTQFTNTNQDFTDLLFGTTGKTMSTYYDEVSQGRFTVAAGPEGVIGVLKVTGTHDSYATNGDKLVLDAVTAADNAGIDFSPYDQDGDGSVDLTCVIHQGNGAETSGDATDIHSYQGYLPTPYQTKDSGVKIDRYFLAPETVNGGLNTIGVFCHEYGHALGLPDLYDTDYSSSGIDAISLMASGVYGDGGATPVHMDAWCKLQLGWANLRTVTRTSLNTQISTAANGNMMYKVPITDREYYLLENRQRTKFDSALPTTGLAIYHVDENITSSNTKEWFLPHIRNNTFYTGLTRLGHYLVALQQADGSFDLESTGVDTGGQSQGSLDRGDLYPGSTNNRKFTYEPDTTATSSMPPYKVMPPCVKYDGNRGTDPGFGILNISDSAATMTADIRFTDNATPTPVPTPPNNMFTRAQSLGSDGKVSSGGADGSNFGADKEAGEPDHAGNAGGASIWYKFSTPGVGPLTINTQGSAIDTTLAVYTGSSVSSLTLVASNNDYNGATWSQVSFTANRDTTYYIAVDGINKGDTAGVATGDVRINFSQTVTRPANDDFDRAQTLNVQSTSVTGTNINATRQTGEPSHANNGGAASVWYRWNCLQSGTATFTTQGSDFDTLLAAYTGSTVSGLTAVASNDDYVQGSKYSRISFAATAGTTYYIAVDGYLTTPMNYASGNIKLTSSVPVIYGIQGNVTSLNNGTARGVANVAVTATRTTDNKTFTAGTSSAGGYAILNLAPGTYMVAVSSPNLKGTYIGTAKMPITVTAGSPLVSNINFRVQPTVTGKVYNAIALKTVSGVTVRATSGETSVQVTTDATGSYSLPLDPGTYTLSATSTDGTTYSATFSNPVTVGTSASTTSYNFRALGVTGRTVTLSNQAVSGVTVNVYRAADTAFATVVGTGVTDSNGFFSIEKIGAGSYVVRPVAPAGRSITPATRAVTITSSPSFSVFNVTVAASGTRSVGRRSNLTLSSTAANAGAATVTLKFTGPLDAGSVAELAHYQVLVNGAVVSVETATLSQGDSVVLTLPAGSLSSGDVLHVAWSGLSDAAGGTLTGDTTVSAS